MLVGSLFVVCCFLFFVVFFRLFLPPVAIRVRRSPISLPAQPHHVFVNDNIRTTKNRVSEIIQASINDLVSLFFETILRGKESIIMAPVYWNSHVSHDRTLNFTSGRHKQLANQIPQQGLKMKSLSQPPSSPANLVSETVQASRPIATQQMTSMDRLRLARP